MLITVVNYGELTLRDWLGYWCARWRARKVRRRLAPKARAVADRGEITHDDIHGADGVGPADRRPTRRDQLVWHVDRWIARRIHRRLRKARRRD